MDGNLALNELTIVGARQHNLKGLSVRLPRDRLVVFTGPSGSGKSSLAFDTIYAEGQRRYVESLSAYARQFLEQLPKPDVESIEGLSPAIAIEQRPLTRNPRSTVGTVTEIADYLRLLYARVGTPHCPKCGKRIEAQTVQEIVDRILGFGDGERAMLLAPICRARRGELKIERERLRREGFVRVRIDGEVVDLGEEFVLDRARPHDLDVVVDRVVVRAQERQRLADSVEVALRHGDGVVLVAMQAHGKGAKPADRNATWGEPVLMSERFACVACGVSLPSIEPRMFSFNGPHGACSGCDGLGMRTHVDAARVVPDESRTLREGAIVPWGRRGSLALAMETDRAVAALGVAPDVPFAALPPSMRDALLYQSPSAPGDALKRGKRGKKTPEYIGIVARLERLLAGAEPPADDTDDDAIADGPESDTELGRFVVTRRCDSCDGMRLRPEALAVRLGGLNIAELGKLPLHRVRDKLAALRSGADATELGPPQRAILEPLAGALLERLRFLIDVGLDYLSLDRSAETLSGGEGQRIRLATQIGSALVGVLYVLDEPSVGLHAKDNEKLLVALRRLVTLGNSVVVVEHDRDSILAADYVVDIGPGAGVHGGEIVAEGTPAEVMQNPRSVTGPYLTGEKTLVLPGRRKPRSTGAIRIEGAHANNLAGIDVEIPTGLLVAVTGVSGSGKSTLVIDTLHAAARAKLYRATGPVGACDRILGLEDCDKVIAINQAPIGRTPRSNPATYTGLFATLRELYAGLPEARARGYKSGRFSFNVKGGRCESCQGDGVLRVEMHFLPDLFVKCEACAGRRYNRETLEIRYRGMSIADALDLTVLEARAQFEALGKLRDRLDALARTGLGYLQLGQAATTLSGGEAQRVKLARELAKKATGRTLYILDEPTTGLHFMDIELLMVALAELRDAGNSVVVIEHNIDFIACCDWVIDLGPGGGEHGGRLLAAGTPEHVASCADSPTGTFLAARLGLGREEAPRRGATTRAAKVKAAGSRRTGRSGEARARTPR
ncbi:MAG: excinuclease ABC subunit UvrA [Myxococcales bacterium]|nr:excinuclease ABC subunit UvrA [Myxococcales bacterium]